MAPPSTAIPPGPPGLPIAGNALQYARDALTFFERCREYGDVSSVTFGGPAVFVLSAAELVDQVLVRNARNYVKDDWQRNLARELFGDGLLMSEGALWKRQRRMMQPAFHKERIHAYGEVMVSRADAWADRFTPDASRDVYADMMGLTLDVAARTLFGADVDGQKDGVGRALAVVMERIKVASESFLPLPRWLPTPGNIRYLRAISAVDRVCAEIIGQRRARGGDSGDLLSMLLAARDEDDGGGMSDRQLRDEVVTLLVAGHETTAIALTFALWLLGRHPEAEAKLREELARVLGGRPPRMEDLGSLPVTDAVLKEAMRLYPPAWALSRAAVGPDSLGGYAVTPGRMVTMSQWVVHRDARHFPEPERFNPDRWLDGLEHRLPRGAYFPFGGGPRLCIGVAFAQVEAKLILARLLQRLRFEPVTEKVALMCSITMRPKHAVRMVPKAA